jgi:hypothetical protein
VVLTLPEGWGCRKQSWYKLSKQPVASKGTLHIVCTCSVVVPYSDFHCMYPS